jgi:hypothetical protein
MPETFPDGFPMTPAEAIEFSYFFSEEEKQEWREWLKTVTDEEKTEMVNTLHTIWMDKQKQVVPDQFSGNTNNFGQMNQNQINNQPNFTPQPDFYNSNPTQPYEQNINAQSPATSPFDFQPSNLPEFNFDEEQKPITQVDNSFQSPANELNAPTPPEFTAPDIIQKSFSDGEGKPSQNLNQTTGNPILDDTKPNPADFGLIDDSADDFNFDFDDDFDLDGDKTESEETSKSKNTDQDSDIKAESDNENNLPSDFTPEIQPEVLEIQEEPAEEVKTPTKQSVNFSISKVREEATEKELNDLYQNYLNSRSSVSSTKQDHDQSYDKLMDKVIAIVLNFESVADYLEFMTTKLSQMNETIMKQAEEITMFKNGQNNYAHDLRQEVTELLSRVEVLENRVESDLGNYRTRLDKFEVKFSGQSDSAYTGYDSLSTQIDLLKSKLIKMEKSETEDSKLSDLNQTHIKPTLTTVIPHPNLPLEQKAKDNPLSPKSGNPLPPKKN